MGYHTIESYLRKLPLEQVRQIMMDDTGKFPRPVTFLAAKVYIHRFGEGLNYDLPALKPKKDSPE